MAAVVNKAKPRYPVLPWQSEAELTEVGSNVAAGGPLGRCGSGSGFGRRSRSARGCLRGCVPWRLVAQC